MATDECTPGWKSDGSYWIERIAESHRTLLDQLIAAGYTYKESNTHLSEVVDFRWHWSVDNQRTCWIPQNEGARLWLQLNAP